MFSKNLGKIGFVFDGGGFTAACGAGHRLAMALSGLEPVYSQGISGGAFNALAENPYLLVKVWQVVEKKGPSFIFPLLSLSTLKNLRRAVKGLSPFIFDNRGLQELLRYLNFPSLVASLVRYEVGVFNETRWRQEFVSNHDDDVKENPEVFKRAVLASASIHEFFPPVCIYKETGDWYSDGQLFSIQRAFDYGCERVFVFLNSTDGPPPRGRGVMGEIMENKNIVGAIAKRREIELFRDRVVVLGPPKDIETLSSISFRRGDISRMIEMTCEGDLKTLASL